MSTTVRVPADRAATRPGQQAPASRAARKRRNSPNRLRTLSLLAWIGPSVALVVAVVVYPLFETLRAAFQKFSLTGAVKGWAGFANFEKIFSDPDLTRVLINTLIWVVCGVAITTLLALPMGQLLNREFRGRRLLRIALIVPWATSVVMTAIGFRWILNYYYGVLNPFLMSLHIIDAPVDWLGDERTIMPVMIFTAVFISLPFTSFAVLAGLKGIPEEVKEASQIDGASRWQAYRHITLPLLRGPLMVTVLLNSIWIFNSFPIIYVLNKSNPGYQNDTTITFMYKIAFLTDRDIGAGAAMAVFNVLIIGVCVAFYVRRARLE
ncbi:sugar ABC transporter permease [Subtercola sp. PAMC28395]|uniref:carbohydrate ABC transporter permease n=1 Tax=Subtercola sp. PAMC28395 TaxID=2846775 RepID=UPI001C0B541B|nr:sugar ABC transporter permease [Subtercola sp. PAMC28395]QWT24166.1 sugar ABC transporter permease [Subtercola sp. PAMC28395]